MGKLRHDEVQSKVTEARGGNWVSTPSSLVLKAVREQEMSLLDLEG